MIDSIRTLDLLNWAQSQRFWHHKLKFTDCLIYLQSISPGIVKTGIGNNCYNFEKQVSISPMLHVDDVVDAVMYALSTGPNVLVSFWKQDKSSSVLKMYLCNGVY